MAGGAIQAMSAGIVLDNKYELKNQFKVRPAWEIWTVEELQRFPEPQ